MAAAARRHRMRVRGWAVSGGVLAAAAVLVLLVIGREPPDGGRIKGGDDVSLDLVRERAAWALSQGTGDRLVDPLLDALDSADWRIRAYAAWALAPARDPRATGRLVLMLGHPVWRLRAMAAHALRELADPAVSEEMNAVLTDPADLAAHGMHRRAGALLQAQD